MFSVSRPSEFVVLNCWVTATKLTPCLSNVSTMREKSSSDRLRRSTLYTTTQSISPASTFGAGHRQPAVDGMSYAKHGGAVLSGLPTVGNRILRWSNAKIGIVRNFKGALASTFR